MNRIVKWWNIFLHNVPSQEVLGDEEGKKSSDENDTEESTDKEPATEAEDVVKSNQQSKHEPSQDTEKQEQNTGINKLLHFDISSYSLSPLRPFTWPVRSDFLFTIVLLALLMHYQSNMRKQQIVYIFLVSLQNGIS